ncbi:hypothetical protein CEXT_37441 [Caerostris extrusa]|uniref:Uncharacterized protein n=1 Tax=Caerostris extrusa TaxID=172846 RepID=A0AAV4RRM9_CAEEX|nr:hypothetical protein CEXT_37441 [Caerostris extrusa]
MFPKGVIEIRSFNSFPLTHKAAILDVLTKVPNTIQRDLSDSHTFPRKLSTVSSRNWARAQTAEMPGIRKNQGLLWRLQPSF